MHRSRDCGFPLAMSDPNPKFVSQTSGFRLPLPLRPLRPLPRPFCWYGCGFGLLCNLRILNLRSLVKRSRESVVAFANYPGHQKDGKNREKKPGLESEEVVPRLLPKRTVKRPNDQR